MTLTQMRTAVRTATRVPSTTISDAELTTWINEGLYKIAAADTRWQWLEGYDTFVTVADQQAYAFTDIAADCERLVSIARDGKTDSLQQLDQSTAITMYGGDMPAGDSADAFYEWEDSIFLIPIPETADLQYNVWFYESPVALSGDSDTPQFDAQFHSALTYYCEMRVWLHEEELQKAVYAEGQFYRILGDMLKWYRDRASDQPWGIGVPQQRRGINTNTPFTNGL